LGDAVEGRRVVKEGLKPSDEIIVDGQARVRPGMKVAPEKERVNASILLKQSES
jgi:multidrug efflux pump subunit AcrA (membrane-fusion protein)